MHSSPALLRTLKDRLFHLTVDMEQGARTVHVDGDVMYAAPYEVLDETDSVLKAYRDHGHAHPIIEIRAVRKWRSTPDPEYDTIPDDVLDSFCDGLPPTYIVMDFSDLFARHAKRAPWSRKALESVTRAPTVGGAR
jgi:hypothetical protein